uniref:Uncharacterized protein n=1 Tax=Arundo donax TaxID=35708 RepID=A0A0A9DVU5_ARUDO
MIKLQNMMLPFCHFTKLTGCNPLLCRSRAAVGLFCSS